MSQLPNRLDNLIDAIEQGEPVTLTDVERLSNLIALDTASYERDKVLEALERTRDADQVVGEPINV